MENKKQPFNSALKQRYKKYCTVLTSTLKKAKRDYYENQIFVSGSNNGKQWRLLNEFMHNNSSRNRIAEINHEGNTRTHLDEIANAFTIFFSAPLARLLQTAYWPAYFRLSATRATIFLLTIYYTQ